MEVFQAALSYFMTPEEEEDGQKLYAGADIADPSYIMKQTLMQ